MKKSLLLSLIFISILGSATKIIYDTITSLKKEILDLRSTNKQLVKKQQNIKKKLVERRRVLISQKLDRAKRKIIKTPTTIVPIVGTFAAVGFTAYEIKEFCEDIKSYKEFEKSIFSDTDIPINEEEKLLCGLSVEEELLPNLKDLAISPK